MKTPKFVEILYEKSSAVYSVVVGFVTHVPTLFMRMFASAPLYQHEKIHHILSQ